jgi:hypothetical protein
LLSGHDQPLFYTLGNDGNIEVPSVQSSDKQLLTLVKGNQRIIPDARQREGSTLLYMPDQLTETGLYELKRQDSLVSVIAFNDNRKESDLTYFNAAELAKLLPQAGPVIDAGKGSLKGTITETNFGLQLWKLCIILTLIFLAIEILLIRFYKTQHKQLIQPV